MTDELMPCPFCGGDMWTGKVETPDGDNGWKVSGYRAWCKNCETSMREAPTEAEAITAWNTRATPAQTKGDDLVERLSNWADVLDIPSGDFVNQDLRQAASRIQSLTASNEALERERDAALDQDWVATPAYEAAMADARMLGLRALGWEQNWQYEREAKLEAMTKLQAAQAEIATLREALAELVDSLTPAEHASGRDPAYGDTVRKLGSQIGFGALMSCASTEWRLWLEQNGYPLGSEFVSGPCRSVLQSDLARARTALTPQEPT